MKNRKGFTIVELVIVIAIVAVLAGVLIPTFASIIDKSNESADIQAVRQMNVALAVESIENKPDTVDEVITILSEAGYNSMDKLVPVSDKHGFYWCKAANMITLIRDEGENSPTLIFPTEEAAVNTAFEAAKTKSAINFGADKAVASNDRTFFDLEPAGEDAGLPSNGSGGSGGNTTVHVAGVSLDQTTATLNIGGTVTLTATVAPTNATNKNVTWSTSAPTVATVADGVVTAKAEGVAVIIVATEDGSKMATCTVTVNGSGEGNEQLPDDPDKGVGTAADLKTALEAGGEYYLTEDIILATAVNIPVGITSKLHLNGYTLTLEDPSGVTSDVISVSGSLTITNGEIVIATPTNQNAQSYNRGIFVNNSGTLELKNVVVYGNREWNIENHGTVSLTGVNFTVNDGFGLTNYGTATITGGSFVANGTETTQMYNVGGTMRITKTAFSEGNSFSSYGNGNAAPIHANGGAITLNGVTVTTKTAPSVYAGYENNTAQITVESGSFNSKFSCLSGSSVTVKGGTFSDKTFAELYAASDDAVKEALCSSTGLTVTRADNVITLTRN